MAGDSGNAFHLQDAKRRHTLPLGKCLRGDFKFARQLVAGSNRLDRPRKCFVSVGHGLSKAMLEKKSSTTFKAVVCPTKASLYPAEMTLGKRIKEARKAIPHLTQEAVGRALGVTDKAVSAWERDADTPTPDKFPKLAEILKKSVAYLHGEPEKANSRSQTRDGNTILSEKLNPNVRNPTLNMIPAADLYGEADLPVYSIVQGGRGVLVLENEPFTRTTRPRRLEGRKDGYGVLVIGNSMSEAYNEGDIAYVDPRLHPRKGDPCVFQGIRQDGTVEAMMKYLERSPDASETLYYVRTGLGAKPVRKFTVKKADWQKVHVVVGKESGR